MTASFRSQLGPVFFLAVIFLINFTSRIILSPLLPTIERELAISHSQAGFFFFLTSGGYLVGLLLSGLFASRSTHRLAIIVSVAGVGIGDVDRRLCDALVADALRSVRRRFRRGLYLPSAIATITSLVDKRHWGKAIAVHELAPNVAFFISPFIAELFLRWASWRGALGFLGALSIAASMTFSKFGRGGGFPGESPFSVAFVRAGARAGILDDGHAVRFGCELHRLASTRCCRCIW